ncbi:MAG: hypothetical protein ACJA0Q_001683 [Saprospiraceae bacterium]|jgi:hypothetical protein
MKKTALIILVIGFAVGAKAQNNPEQTVEVNNECVQEETGEHYEAKTKDKRKNRMAAYANTDPSEQNASSNSPYAFASNESNVTDSKSKASVMVRIQTFFRTKIFRRNL